MQSISRNIATLMGLGFISFAPGTLGSLATLPLFAMIFHAGGPAGTLIALPLILFFGWWATQRYTQLHKNHDPSEVIIDEVAGQWIALLPLAAGATHAGASLFALWPGWIAAFLLFRLFDIWKPSIIGWADRRSDAIGVMLDDCFAGLFAALGVIALAGLFHGLLS